MQDNKSPIMAKAKEDKPRPYRTMAEMDLMHYHHVQRSNDASMAFDRVRANKDFTLERFNINNCGWQDGARYSDGSILTMVDLPIFGLKLLALTQSEIDYFDGFTPAMMRQIEATSSPFSY